MYICTTTVTYKTKLGTQTVDYLCMHCAIVLKICQSLRPKKLYTN